MILDAKTAKAFGGCEKCYGKGYSTQRLGGRVQVNTCVCDRGKQIEEILKQEHMDCVEAVMAEQKEFLSDHADAEYPKGKSKERGAAITHIALFLTQYRQWFKKQKKA